MMSPEPDPQAKIPIFDLRNNIGWIDSFGSLPYRIRYSITASSKLVNKKEPGRNMLTPNTGGGYSLSVFIHKSAPERFRPVVFFHELQEARLMHGDQQLDKKEAHKKAATETAVYVQKLLSQEELKAYKAWQSTLIDPSS